MTLFGDELRRDPRSTLLLLTAWHATSACHRVEVYRPSPGASPSWGFVNVPPASKQPDTGLCGATFDASKGCGYNASAPRGRECERVSGGPGAAMQDHEIFALTWSLPHEAAEAEGVAEGMRDAEGSPPRHVEELKSASVPGLYHGGPVLDVAGKTLTDGTTALTPLVWSPRLTSPLGTPLRNVGMRVVNRTDFYRCKPA